MSRSVKLFFIFLIALLFHSNLYSQVKEKITIKEYKNKSWIGIQIKDIPSDVAEKNNLKNNYGVLITKIEKNSPAEKAGLNENDIILEYNGMEIKNSDDLINLVRKEKPGQKVKLLVLRDKNKKNFTVTIEEKPKNRFFEGKFPDSFPFAFNWNRPKLGLELFELNPELGEYFQSPTKKGMLVKKVLKDSPAEKAGIKPGDVIIGIGKESVEDLHDITSALRDYKKGDKVELTIIRKGEQIKIPVEITEDQTNEDSKKMYFYDDNGNSFNIDLRGLGSEIKTMIEKFKLNNLDDDIHKNIEIEIEKIKPELEKMNEKIKLKLKDIDLDELKKEIEKIKPELEKMKKNIIIQKEIKI
ncbi:MAG TPA: PDZ domain-containing protein [Bacteroidota bacterium]|nr:PDZ domain-containing protein [Bacteroidota bacterium]